jgi:hypothetical protein
VVEYIWIGGELIELKHIVWNSLPTTFEAPDSFDAVNGLMVNRLYRLPTDMDIIYKFRNRIPSGDI